VYNEILIILFAYILGSIPTGAILAKIKGANIRDLGSGNIGATNVTRTLGKKFGAITLLVDVLKGFIPVVLIQKYYLNSRYTGFFSPELFLCATGITVLAGHIYSVFLKFHGGKGVATSLGIAAGIIPKTAGVAAGLWLVIFLVSRISSLSALIAVAGAPVATYFFYGRSTFFYFSILIPIIVVYTHQENISRLFRGKEKGFNKTQA